MTTDNTAPRDGERCPRCDRPRDRESSPGVFDTIEALQGTDARKQAEAEAAEYLRVQTAVAPSLACPRCDRVNCGAQRTSYTSADDAFAVRDRMVAAANDCALHTVDWRSRALDLQRQLAAAEAERASERDKAAANFTSCERLRAERDAATRRAEEAERKLAIANENVGHLRDYRDKAEAAFDRERQAHEATKKWGEERHEAWRKLSFEIVAAEKSLATAQSERDEAQAWVLGWYQRAKEIAATNLDNAGKLAAERAAHAATAREWEGRVRELEHDKDRLRDALGPALERATRAEAALAVYIETAAKHDAEVAKLCEILRVPDGGDIVEVARKRMAALASERERVRAICENIASKATLIESGVPAYPLWRSIVDDVNAIAAGAIDAALATAPPAPLVGNPALWEGVPDTCADCGEATCRCAAAPSREGEGNDES